MIGIYKITNQINGKCYIGKSVDIYNRWIRHRSRAFQEGDQQYNCYLYRSIRKYGLDNFIFEIIEECTFEDLNSREIFYIDFYHSFDKTYGYNMTRGGDGTLKQDYEEVCDLWSKGYTVSDIAKAINGSRNTVKNILKVCNANYSEDVSRKRGIKKKSYAINQYDLNSIFIKKWDSARQIERELHIDHSDVIKCCNWIHKTAGGYKWKYAERSETSALADLLD